MAEISGARLSRVERELIHYFRGLSLQEQLDILGQAQAGFNTGDRMRRLAERETERSPEEERGELH